MISGAYLRNSKIRSNSSNRPASSENDDGKIVSKIKSRQKIEAEYYKEWERLTVVSEEELNRKMTVVTFLRFLPMWLRYNGLPGPLRYLLFHVMPWKKMQNGLLGRLGSSSTTASASGSAGKEEEE
ncbi:hypothetical protein M9435_005471 [Picochlorum sp. BPE23]|nr:hypothetical protein M9435_005471 [Picochlorum sp. BPE23]